MPKPDTLRLRHAQFAPLSGWNYAAVHVLHLGPGMKRVLQHSQTGLFVSIHGGFTRSSDEAHICPNLAAAMLVCARLRLNPSDFVYRIIEPDTSLLSADFYGHPKAA